MNDTAKTILCICIAAICIFFPVDCISGHKNWKNKFGNVVDKQIEIDRQYKDDRLLETTSYSLVVNVQGYVSEVEVSKENYIDVHIGDKIQVIQRIGGITGWSYGYGFENKVTGLPAEN